MKIENYIKYLYIVRKNKMNDIKIKSYYRGNYLRPWVDTNSDKTIVRESGCFPVKYNDLIL